MSRSVQAEDGDSMFMSPSVECHLRHGFSGQLFTLKSSPGLRIDWFDLGSTYLRAPGLNVRELEALRHSGSHTVVFSDIHNMMPAF